MIINIPKDAKYIIDTLMDSGYEAYVVGGCVRDALLNKSPMDWDITTNALPNEVKELFKRTVDTGLKHGTVTIMIDKVGYEVTTYRVDGEYKDGRHPENVEFTRSLIEDLKRRDFTINAMAYNDRSGIVDEFKGLSDLEKGVIRCVGNPMDRFNEDALRMMRAVRFSAQLGFVIDDNTAKAIKHLAKNILLISAERIRVELTKTLISSNPRICFLLCDYGISPIILPVLNEHICEGRRELISEILNYVEPDTYLRYSLLYSYSGEKETIKALRNLKFDNKTIGVVSKIVKYIHEDFIVDEIWIRHMLKACSSEIFSKLIEAKLALSKGLKEPFEHLYEIQKLTDKILDRGDAYEISMLDISGNDLLDLGIERGSKIGEILGNLLEEVIKNPSLNQKEILKGFINIP